MQLQNKIKKYLSTLLLLFIIVGQFGILFMNSGESGNISDNLNKPIAKPNKLKNSGYWSPDYIHIDNNWSQAANLDWVQDGLGTWKDPFIIENVTIDAQTSGSCIFINNTDEYFIIRNCTLLNAQYSGDFSGIQLENVTNGMLIDCNFTENSMGTNLRKSSNITIQENFIQDSAGWGIRLYMSEKNFIFNNELRRNGRYGIILTSQSHNNTILDNLIDNNQHSSSGYGIYFTYIIFDNEIKGNRLINNHEGIRFSDQCDKNIIDGNNISDNSDYGVMIATDDRDSEDNLFYNNHFNNPDGMNAYDNGTNTMWDNGTIGNYWHDYDGVDADDDGIGDTAYAKIGGASGSMDRFPIWADGDDSKEDGDENNGTDDQGFIQELFDFFLSPIGLIIGLVAMIALIGLAIFLKRK